MSKKHPNRKRRGLAIPILGVILLAISGLLYFAARWYEFLYGSQSFNSVLVTLFSGIDGAADAIMFNFLCEVVLMTLLCTVGLTLWCCHRSRFHLRLNLWGRKITLSPVRPGIYLAACILIFVLGIYQAAQIVQLPQWLNNVSNSSTLLEEEYADPSEVRITFPEKKRNLIYIMLESMETTFCSKDQGGCLDECAIPELYTLAQENVSFSDTEGIGGWPNSVGTSWTTGAVVAQAGGIPLLLPFGRNKSNILDSPLNTTTMLWDILSREGYYQTMMLGSDGEFSGMANLLTGHGCNKIYDWNTAQEDGLIPEGYEVWWGFEDSKLFEYARQELPKIAAREEPFQFTLMTMDTHMPEGYVCPDCPEAFSEQYENVYACSSAQVAAFVAWLQEQPFYEDTTIIICGDHLSMDKSYFERNNLMDSHRRVYNCILNSAAETGNTKNRLFTSMDMFPTILAAMGCRIEGDRLGLGTNLFSDLPTLAERIGPEQLDKELNRSTLPYLFRFLLDPEKSQWLMGLFPNLVPKQ